MASGNRAAFYVVKVTLLLPYPTLTLPDQSRNVDKILAASDTALVPGLRQRPRTRLVVCTLQLAARRLLLGAASNGQVPASCSVSWTLRLSAEAGPGPGPLCPATCTRLPRRAQLRSVL